MRALHDLPVPPEAPRIDWVGMLVEQALDVHVELARAGLSTSLLDGLRAYLGSRHLSWEGRLALLHGDLDAINLLVEREANGNWRVTGLVDWSDAKVGPVAHDFISPGAHRHWGHRSVQRAWHAGYGLDNDPAAFEHQVMARAILYYPDTLPAMLRRAPGVAAATTWVEVARACWHVTTTEAEQDG